MDTKTKEERSRNMAGIRSKNTKPEIYLRKLLFAHGYRYRLHSKKLPGKPDLWMKKYNTAVFVHGCFWHRHEGCKDATMPKTKTEFWNVKFSRNILRDQAVRQQLLESNIKCLIVWECTIKKMEKSEPIQQRVLEQIAIFLENDSLFLEI